MLTLMRSNKMKFNQLTSEDKLGPRLFPFHPVHIQNLFLRSVVI